MKPELLAPAGDLERLIWACHYGADAVYFGLDNFSLRNFANNFGINEARQGLEYLHSHGKQGFITLNIYPFTDEYDEIVEIAKELENIKADGLIIADIGLINVIRKAGISIPIHVSTQANTVSAQTALFYADLGCSRVNLARELSFEQIKEIKEKVGDKIELEVFVHGSVCFSYSGRCAISDYLVGRQANRGKCSQPCRWGYHLVEEKRDGNFMPVLEDKRGLYFYNSRDLALYNYIEKLSDIGINSFKIEGRMKTIHYIASVLPIYRKLIDKEKLDVEYITKMLGRVSNRGYTEGFMKGFIDPDSDYKTQSAEYEFTSVLIGHTKDSNALIVNNSFSGGDVLEILTKDNIFNYKMPDLLETTTGEQMPVVNNSHKVLMPENFPKYAILRKIK